MTRKYSLPQVRKARAIEVTYNSSCQVEWPHVLKLSGGRSSGMLLLGLLKAKALDASRGDVIIFNNTSAEHPATYKFVKILKEVAEQRYNIPFFWVEFQTYEDARCGRWTRVPSYRLVKPHSYANNRPLGFKRNGEVFEELISWKQMLPSRFSRICTQFMKVHTTVEFLRDWFAAKPMIERLGHWDSKSRVDKESFGDRLKYARCHLRAPIERLPQRFQDYTDAKLQPLRNPSLEDKVFGGKARMVGYDPVEFVTLVGLRADEPERVARAVGRNNFSASSPGASKKKATGENVYAPLFNHGIDKKQILDFWENQNWQLDIPDELNLSNCVYCFMKKSDDLANIASSPEISQVPDSWKKGPVSIGWWDRIEKKYARAAKNGGNNGSSGRFGFFGLHSSESYASIRKQNIIAKDTDTKADAVSCECTD